MPGESSSSASLRRRSSLSRDGLPLDSTTTTTTSTPSSQQYNNSSRQYNHTRGTSTSTSIHYYQQPPTVEEHEELTVDFEDSVHLNSLNGSHNSPNGKMGRNTVNGSSSYSSLPTSNGHHDYPGSSSSSASSHSSKRRSTGRSSNDSRWSTLAKWQKNAIILTAVLVFGLILINSGKGQAKEYVLKKTTSSGGTATSDEDNNKVIQRPAAIPSDKQQLPDYKQGTHETGVVKASPDSLSDSIATAGGAKKVPSGAACILPEGKPEFQYALMIDAGSTGSRMHVYKFSNCLPEGTSSSSSLQSTKKDAPLPTLVDEIFYPVTPGLSSYRGRPKAAAESLTKLMEEAMKAVPKNERSCTPVAVKATAGLRLLGAKESQEILDEVERWLKEEWPFQVVEDGVVIMDGKDEGVYAWITINYLLGLVGPGKKAGQSAAVMDLGGASTQIVFEPSFPSTSKLSPGDHVYDLNFASEDHTLYQHSHLGYGLMQARRSVHNLVAFTHLWSLATKSGPEHKEWDDLTEDDLVYSPCLVKGGRKTILLDPPGRKAVNITLVGTGAGFDACRRVVDVVMAKDALCEEEPCAFGGIYQPRLMETFGSTSPIYALSYFYDRIVPLGLGADGKPFTIQQLRELTEDVCAGPSKSSSSSSTSSSNVRGWNRFKGNAEAMAELEDRPEYCLDLSFMYSLLSLGYELAPERELVTGKKINDIELGWALGAGIALLEHSSLHCRNPDA